MKKIVSMFAALAVVFGVGLSRSAAAESKPIAAVSVASYDDLLSDVNFVGGLIEQPQLGATLEGFLAMATQGKKLAGVDTARPWGVIVQASGEENFTAYLFVPVTDFKQLLGLLRLYGTDQAEGGVYKLTPKTRGQVSYVKQQGEWAFFAAKPEVLAQCTADPVALVGKMKKGYILGGRIFLANIPGGLREKFISGFQKGIEQDAATKKSSESAEEFSQRKKLLEQFGSYMTRVFGELDQVVFGWGLDRTAEKTFVHVGVTAKAGTKTAEEMGLAAQAMTNFAGFRLPGAAVAVGLAGTMPAAKQEIAASMIEAGRGKALADIDKNSPQNKRAVAKEMVNGGADLLQKIVKSGRVNAAASACAYPQGRHGPAGRLRRRRRVAG